MNLLLVSESSWQTNNMMNKKRGLTDSVSCPTMEIPGRRITYLNPVHKKCCLFVCLFVCSGLTSLSTLFVISRRCLVVTGSTMLTLIVLPHCGIRSQTLLPDTTSSRIILTPERPVLALPRQSECQAGRN